MPQPPEPPPNFAYLADEHLAPPLLPHSREAEEAVIGSVLIAPDLYDTLSGVVGASDFYIHRLGFIWTAFTRLLARNADIDILTVGDELDDMGRLDEVGGTSYLTSLLNQVPSTLHAESYAATVKNDACKREFYGMANRLAEYSLNGKTAGEISAYVEKELGRISTASNIETSTILSSRDAVALGMAKTEAAANGDVIAVPTGLIDLDKFLRGGLRGGQLVLVAGRPGDGKSSLLLTIAGNAAVTHKKRVGVFSMEMPTGEQVNRLISQLSGVPSDRIEAGQLQDEDWPPYYHSVEVVSDADIYWDDTPALSVYQLRAKARKMKEWGLDLIVLDSLNLMVSDMKNAKKHEEINALGYALKVLARELDIPIIAAHHMSRSIETGGDREPQLSDLEQAGEKPADIVIFIHQKKEDPAFQNVRRLVMAKHRGGPVGSVDTIFRANLTKFENCTIKKFDLGLPTLED